MEQEAKLAELIYGRDPLGELSVVLRGAGPMKTINQKQFALFYSRLIARVEERLGHQFGACLALLEEKSGQKAAQIAQGFIRSPEYRVVREDLEPTEQTDGSTRFELQFLNYILRTHATWPEFTDEFSEIFLAELAAQ